MAVRYIKIKLFK